MDRDQSEDKSIFWDSTVGVGILLFMMKVLDMKLGLAYVIFGPLLPYTQDLDYIPDYLRGGSWVKRRGFHRTWTHTPIMNIFASLLVGLIFRSLIAGIFCGVLFFWHLVHDSLTSLGIPWFGPFSWRYYKLYHKGEWLKSWSEEEVDEILQREGEPWEKKYFRMHRKNVVHLLVLLPIYLMMVLSEVIR